MKRSNLSKLNEQLADLAELSKSLDLEVNHGQQMTEEQMVIIIDSIYKRASKVADLSHRCITNK